MATTRRQVSTEEMFGDSFPAKRRYTGRNRLESRKDSTRMDQKGQSILPRKKIEIKKTSRKYRTPMGLSPLGVFSGLVF
jgi:hypothetical protein